MKTFEEWVREAEEAGFSGWDFSWLDGRWWEDPPPWDYRERVVAALVGVRVLLDMGTGGGEFLASLGPLLPPTTYATEAYAPNAALARYTLDPWAVTVLEIREEECYPHPPQDACYPIPLDDAAVDLVINRHEAFDAREVCRVLRPGGRFITQQVGSRNFAGLNERLGSALPFEAWTLAEGRREVEAAGLVVVEAGESLAPAGFRDIGAVIYYLEAVPWQVPGFAVDSHRAALEDIHRECDAGRPLLLESHRFFIEAVKPEA
jgi:SAM-dependent methyltransferase